MDFTQIETYLEDLWLYNLISHEQFVEDPNMDDFLFDYKGSLVEQVIIQEMTYYILSLGGRANDATRVKEAIESNEDFVTSTDPLVKYFLIGIDLWQEYIYLNNDENERIFEIQKEVKTLYDQIFKLYSNDKSKLKYLVPYYAIIGTLYRKYGFFKNATILEQGFEFSITLDNPLYIVISYFNVRELFEDTYKIEKAIELGFRCIDILKALNAPLYEAFVIFLVASLEYKTGNIPNSINLIEKAKNLYDSPGYRTNGSALNGQIICHNQLGRIYSMIGNMTEAFNNYTEALLLYRTISGRKNPSLLSNLGEFYAYKGDYENSISFQLEALEIRKQRDFSSSNQIPLAESYFILLRLYIYFNNLNEAEKYLNDLAEITKHWHDKIIWTQYKLGTALLLKENKTMHDYVKAQELLNEILNNPIASIELTTTAMIVSIEISLVEYKYFHTKENLDHLQQKIEFLKKFSLENNSPLISIKAMILQGKLEIVNSHLDKAEELFSESLQLAEKQNLHDLTQEIESELKVLNDELIKTRELFYSNFNIRTKIEELELEKYLDEIQTILRLFRK